MIAFPLIAEEPSFGWSIYLWAVVFGLIGFGLWMAALFGSLDDEDEDPSDDEFDAFAAKEVARREQLKAAALGKKAR